MDRKFELRLIINSALEDEKIITNVETEHKFALAEGRRWRCDFALPSLRLAIEYEGIFGGRTGQSGKSRHLTARGYSDDCEKYSVLSGVYGWRLVRVTPILMDDGRAGELVRRAIREAVRETMPS
jgi:hypothetical protein